jgi:hypothetical protein
MFDATIMEKVLTSTLLSRLAVTTLWSKIEQNYNNLNSKPLLTDFSQNSELPEEESKFTEN